MGPLSGIPKSNEHVFGDFSSNSGSIFSKTCRCTYSVPGPFFVQTIPINSLIGRTFLVCETWRHFRELEWDEIEATQCTYGRSALSRINTREKHKLLIREGPHNFRTIYILRGFEAQYHLRFTAEVRWGRTNASGLHRQIVSIASFPFQWSKFKVCGLHNVIIGEVRVGCEYSPFHILGTYCLASHIRRGI
jgi:hypothetical protein